MVISVEVDVGVECRIVCGLLITLVIWCWGMVLAVFAEEGSW
jgi:hypothetical protein